MDETIAADNRGFPRRLLIWIVAIASAIFLGVMGYQFYSEKEKRKQDYVALTQLGLALNMHQKSYGAFPAGSTLIEGHPPEKGHSWMVFLLPYMEQITLFELVNRREPWDHATNVRVAKTPYYFFNQVHHKTNESPYVGIAGVGRDAANYALDNPMAGVFGYKRTTRLNDITDGTNSTAMVIEAGQDRGPWMSGGEATVRGLDPSQAPYLGRNGQFGRKGGTMVLYANGSVRWIEESIDPKVFEALATIHGEEQVPEEYRSEPAR